MTKATTGPKPLLHRDKNVKIDKDKKVIEPIIGKAIFDSNLVNYLSNVGADISIKNENLFNKLKTNSQNEITPYQGNILHSCSGEIRVLGTIKIKEQVIDPKFILHDIQCWLPIITQSTNVF